MPRKSKKPLTFSERLQKTLDKHNKRAAQNQALYRAEQKRQGKRPDQPISIMDMIRPKKK